jgi:membrane associated rhomboid family serine protease
MLSDRPYMHGEYPRRTTSAVIWLISALIAAFVLELVLLSPWLGASGPDLVGKLPLTIDNLRHWRLWTLLTHSFLHSTANPFHILFTVLGLVFIGRELEALLGARRLLGVYAGAILLSGLCWTAVNWVHGGAHIGAGSAVFAFLVVLAGVHPSLELTLFFFPVSFRIQHIVYAVLAVDLLCLVFYEVGGAPVPLGLTPSAHLGGMLAGWIYFRYLHANNGWDRAPTLTWPKWLRREPHQASAKSSTAPSRKSSPQLRAEVDRILDKINSHGFGALTAEEKRLLDEAKDLLSRH